MHKIWVIIWILERLWKKKRMDGRPTYYVMCICPLLLEREIEMSATTTTVGYLSRRATQKQSYYPLPTCPHGYTQLGGT